MQVFSEKVNHTSTKDFLNIIQSESFEEIFYDVFEVQINGNKYPLEKVSTYKSNPVVSVPINVEGVEIFYPFVLIKGKQEIIFNENNINVPVDVEVPEMIFESFDEIEDYQIESKQEILNQIEEAKSNAKLWAEKVKSDKIQEAAQEIKKHKKALDNTLNQARETLLEDFFEVTQKIKEDIFSWHSDSESKLTEEVNDKIEKISEELKVSLSNDFDESSKHFDKNVKAVIKELYQSIVIPRVNNELKSISTDIVEKVSEIESGLYDKLDETLSHKADVTLVESLNTELENIQKLNVELNDNINKGVSKALSRVGRVTKSFEELTEAVDKKINDSTQEIEQFYSERIELLENNAFDLNDKTRQYFIGLIEENRDNLIEEIRRIKDEKPIEFIIESSKGDPEKISLDKLTKKLNTDIHNKFENYKTDLRKYITVYGGGGGTVAMQFADGGTMNGSLRINQNLTVVGTISASQYLGITSSGGSDVSGLSGNWNSSYNTVNSLSSNWQSTFNSLSTKANLSGGNVFTNNQFINGSLSSNGSLSAVNVVFPGNGSFSTVNGSLSVNNLSGSRVITLSGNPTLGDWFDQSVKFNSSPSFDRPFISHCYTGAGRLSLDTPGLGLRSNGLVAWSNVTTGDDPADTAFSRSSAGRLALGNGTAGNSSGTLNLSTINVANLSATGTAIVNGNVGIGSSTLPAFTRTYIEENYTDNQSNGLRVRGVGSSSSVWKGRVVVGGDNAAFLMGEYNSQAWLGGHNTALNAWVPLRINPDGASDLYLGNTLGGGAGAAPIITTKNVGGFVGVGTITPNERLTVVGNISATGTITTNTLIVGSTNATFGATIFASGSLVAGSNNSIAWSGRSEIQSPAVDLIALYGNSSRNSFGRLQFGGTTSSFPALIRSGTGLIVGLADGTNGGSFTASGNLSAGSDIALTTAGKGLQIKSGTNQRAGNATLVAGTVTIPNTTVTANTLVHLTRKTSGGTIGNAITYVLNSGTSFVINSDNPLDTSTFTYFLTELI